MDSQQLIKMANQIGQFFESMPNREAAEKDIATHLKRFWDPRMRSAIVASLDTDEAASMSPIVREAITTHRQMLA
jgi:formate dehydrogenase subunit delta